MATSYCPSDTTLCRSPSSTTDSDTTLCAPPDEYDDVDPKTRCRKTVTFSAAVTTLYSEKPKLSRPLSLDSASFGVAHQKEGTMVDEKNVRSRSTARKRRLSSVTHASQISTRTREDEPSAKRRGPNFYSPNIEVRKSDSRKGLGHLARDSLQLASTKLQPKEAHPSPSQPPADIFHEDDPGVRKSFGRRSAGFNVFSLHRKYVLCDLVLSPSTAHCIAMVDTNVHALLPKQHPELSTSDNAPKFLLHKASGKGNGVFASSPISTGECILAERPILIAPSLIAIGSPLTQFYADMFAKLPPELLQSLKKPLLDQAHKNQQELAEGSLDFFEAIMQAYALAITLPVSVGEAAELAQHRAIFPDMTRVNHSCGPNSHWKWNFSTFSVILTALRPIKPGEEITISYASPHLPSEQRRSTLQSLYSFDCVCNFCHPDSPKAQSQSDEARIKVLSFWDRSSPDSPAHGLPEFEDWCQDQSFSPEVLINAHLEAVDLIEREGLQIVDTHASTGKSLHPGRDLGMHLDSLAMCYGALGDVENFNKWIARALESRGTERPEERIAFRKWMSNPLSFPAWACRTITTSGQQSVKSALSESH